MPRRPKVLPRGLRWRADVGQYQASAQHEGRRIQRLVGTDLRVAKRRLQELRAEVEVGDAPSQSGAISFQEYVPGVIEQRRARGVRSADAEFRHLEKHVFPAPVTLDDGGATTFGALSLDGIRPRHVYNLARDLFAGHLSAKSVRNIVGYVSVILSEAAFTELIQTNPCRSIPRGKLPKATKRRPRPYTADEVGTLLTSESLPFDRRIVYALCALGAMRIGEACGRRWRDLDTTATPLWRLRVATQWDDQPLKGARDEHTAERSVPVHPELRRLLAEWKLTGWAAVYGRHPTLDDFISPYAADPRLGCRGDDQIGAAFRRDVKRLGIARLGTHSFRRFAISAARSGGARKEVFERISHNASGDVLDGYTTFSWEALCEAMLCLRIDLYRARVPTLPVAASASSEGESVPSNVPDIPAGLFSRAQSVVSCGLAPGDAARRGGDPRTD